jgi:CrcB protein
MGSVARYGVSLIGARLGAAFALPTFAVNVTGSFAIGLAMALLLGRAADPASVGGSFLVTGFLGGYTTFSTFAFDALRLTHEGRPAQAALYVVGTTCGRVAGVRRWRRAWPSAGPLTRPGDGKTRREASRHPRSPTRDDGCPLRYLAPDIQPMRNPAGRVRYPGPGPRPTRGPDRRPFRGHPA